MEGVEDMVDGRGTGTARNARGTARAADDSTTPLGRVALFAKSPAAGAVKTRLTPTLTAEQAASLAAAFAADVAAVIASVPELEPWLYLQRGELESAAALAPGWPRHKQAEGDLGARIAAALSELSRDGAHALVVGADHPDLPADRLRQALGTLARADLSFGPTPDGGFYLVAARAAAAPRLAGLFAEIEWSSPGTLSQALARARALGVETRVIEPWYDVDTPEDLRGLCGRLRRRQRAAPATRAALTEMGWLPPQ
jgi:hypothetical protein